MSSVKTSFWVVTFICGLDGRMISFFACNAYVRLLIVLPPPILHFEQKHLTLSFGILIDMVLDMNRICESMRLQKAYVVLLKAFSVICKTNSRGIGRSNAMIENSIDRMCIYS